MDTCGQRQIAAGMGLGMHLPVTSGLKQEVQLYCYVLTPMWIAHLPLAVCKRLRDGSGWQQSRQDSALHADGRAWA